MIQVHGRGAVPHRLVGSSARASLRRHGLLWPAPAHLKGAQVEPARGGAYLTGEGGDEILGAPRIAPWVALREGDRRLSRRTLGELARAGPLPAPLRRGLLQRRARWTVQARTWLRPAAASWMVDAEVADDLSRSLRPAKDVRWLLRRRALRAAMRNIQVVASDHDVQCVHPFLDPAFVSALSGLAGALRWPGRSRMMQLLFGDFLPLPVLERGPRPSSTSRCSDPRPAPSWRSGTEADWTPRWSILGLSGLSGVTGCPTEGPSSCCTPPGSRRARGPAIRSWGEPAPS